MIESHPPIVHVYRESVSGDFLLLHFRLNGDGIACGYGEPTRLRPSDYWGEITPRVRKSLADYFKPFLPEKIRPWWGDPQLQRRGAWVSLGPDDAIVVQPVESRGRMAHTATGRRRSIDAGSAPLVLARAIRLALGDRPADLRREVAGRGALETGRRTMQ